MRALASLMVLFAAVVFPGQPVVALDGGIRSIDSTEHARDHSDVQEPETSSAEMTDPALQSGEQDDSEIQEPLKLLADLRVHSADELGDVLQRVDQLFSNGRLGAQSPPVVFLLHGEEARVLYQQNYTRHQEIVDLAAKLSAFDVVDIRVCAVWANGKGLDNNRLQPFVGTVPYAPKEEKKLVRESGYRYF